MDQKEKRAFTAAAVCSIFLIVSTLMGLAGTISSSGGFSFFAAVSIFNLLTLLYLTVVLFQKRKDRHLGLALGVNALVSLVTVCFFFSWQELFICLTLVLLTVNCFVKSSGKGILFAVSLSAAGILILTITGFLRNAAQAENGLSVFDIGKWAYYFMPFVFALLYAAMANLIALAVNGHPSLKSGCRGNRLSLLPALLLILVTLITAVSAAAGAASKPLLIACGAAAYAAAAAFPFLLSFLKLPGCRE